MSTTVTDVDELRAELRQTEVDEQEFREEADRLAKRARWLRVQIATLQSGREPVKAPPSAEVKLRDYATSVDFYSEDDAMEHTGLSRSKVRELHERLIEEGKVIRIGAKGRNARHAWPKPDYETPAARPRQETPESTVVARERRRGDSVAGVNGNRITRDAHTSKLVRDAKRAGATVTKGRGGHIKIVGDDGMVITGSTPGSGKAHKTEKRLRDLGLAS